MAGTRAAVQDVQAGGTKGRPWGRCRRRRGRCRHVGMRRAWPVRPGTTVWRLHTHGHRGGGGTAVPIGDGVGDDGRAGEARGRDKVQGPVRIHTHRAFGRIDRDSGHGQGIAVRIAIIAQHVDVVDRRIFGGRGHIGIRHRRIVDRRDGHGQGGGGGAAVPIGDGVGDDSRPVVVRRSLDRKSVV